MSSEEKISPDEFAQTSVPAPPTHSFASQEEAKPRKYAPVPGGWSALALDKRKD